MIVSIQMTSNRTIKNIVYEYLIMSVPSISQRIGLKKIVFIKYPVQCTIVHSQIE